ncbi:MAG: DNA-directed RNA polymerase subunit beta' [Candidatus Zambryskibacteria bacterium RIFCSPLOWO2_01_FULL_39_39]|uniref:DNA-directed RNA polymerase subunit beta' n=1 Tax=Candidatus Zambryskibacteria bacterium RIFCSPLOWO2_01_FULL_39_39 TaxID=1802758 RepID=A0A1G2TYA6_9BACT|nr:MAG: DNA-directed RNA polymerase subunit beta' [Candidatus Zambryskibacteria bacterium RIFCSPHIGHO2_01_FULL_39_63]OHA95213.1 MAG: DNA-directed RNA polymerase subunit beta' [Candidatus Zambryskibacteria bacterium RIFCSPHIGHO2_02_FULL_39_19]OHA98745.1 MAG: DNA-directed RNA polymerase subunit beta' [Candidatus Zambryskibacteria bacterium RIFCSPHIGHO2_12_FULL_39_21]OHB02267.1 MAG: DNA-directed RNA polymerase subunit beta' [Candidatus Zambryskibacteria bacterium RIFCSPLOWO2_01_FULL_39_39]
MQNKNSNGIVDFDMIKLSLASPESIKDWSFGEVTKPETINYRTQRSERHGLFDEKIFGPDKDYECYCGKYKGIRYKGIVCEKCGVEITRSVVRRERMGHIDLSAPVAHIWFLKSMPSRIALILGTTSADVEKVIYFAGYIVTKVSSEEKQAILRDLDAEFKSRIKNITEEKEKDELKEKLLQRKKEIESIVEGKVIDEVVYHNYSVKYGTFFEAEIGAEAIYNIFRSLDLNKLEENVRKELEKSKSIEGVKVAKRLSLIQSMIKSGTRPEWMFLTRIPVIPPAMRPMVPLDGGRYATSDVNDLYRRVINRNNRLKKLKEISAPDIILRNEKRILQEAVDALIDNSIRHNNSQQATSQSNKSRELKSLADNLKGKRGLFRQNLLGKRVDYSGRSVIVVGPDLKLHQCGLPKHMALELFKPFVISQLLKQELAYNVRGASRLIDDQIPEVWAILEEVIKDRYVLLNRAPTLHRLGIQAFKPILIEGNAIQVHPLVCNAFNADFDGDQMAVHVPLSPEAQLEAKMIMASDRNILKPGSGNSTISNKPQDIILGCYWATKEMVGEKGEGMLFPNPNKAITAFDFGVLDFRAKIKVLGTDSPKYNKFNNEIFETTIGRLLFNSVLPNDYSYVNTEIDRKKLMEIIEDLSQKYGIESIPTIMDKIKSFGFDHATKSGITFSMEDVLVPKEKTEIIETAKNKVLTIEDQYYNGLLSQNEKRVKNIEIWTEAKDKVQKAVQNSLNISNPVYYMIKSEARGSIGQLTQMAGMKGLIVNTAGETIDFPIISSNKEGLTPIEYFITTHGARKGLTDTALNTAKAGYLTRKLFDVSQDCLIVEEDCGSREGITISKITSSGMEVSIAKIAKGRFLAEDLKDKEGNLLFKRNHFISRDDAAKIETAGIGDLLVRSPLTCKTLDGVCIHCYGADLGKNKIVELGEAVGTVAAQAIGEPGTQLTMRTFHAGGAAQVGGDITSGLPRVEEVFENRLPKNPAMVAKVDGVVSEIKIDGKDKVIIILPEEGEKSKTKTNTEYPVNYHRMILVSVGDKINKGDLLTDGSVDLDELFKYAGKEKTQNYIIHEITKIYELQGEPVSRKHIEIIIKQMFGRRKIKHPGDTRFSQGDIVSHTDFLVENEVIKASGKEEAKAEALLLGITEVSLSRKSFLSSASFQHTTRMLIQNALRGTEDELAGLKENVIIGRLIPAGSGFVGSEKYKMIKELQQKLDQGN